MFLRRKYVLIINVRIVCVFPSVKKELSCCQRAIILVAQEKRSSHLSVLLAQVARGEVIYVLGGVQMLLDRVSFFSARFLF